MRSDRIPSASHTFGRTARPVAGRGLGLAVFAMAWAGAAGAQATVEGELRQRIDVLREVGSVQVAGVRVPAASGIAALYERSGFRPLWTDPTRVDELERAIGGAAADGLDPAHYHASELEGRRGGSGPAAAAELDLLRTHALMLLTRDLRFGRTRPPATPEAAASIVETVAWLLGSADLFRAVGTLRPDHFTYRGLMTGLARLQAVAAGGGWPRVPTGPTLHPGDADPRVMVLRRRLAAEGYAVGAPVDAIAFDRALDAAVRSFQHLHDLAEDGVVGPATLAALNVPVETRIEQVRLNLERGRWVLQELPDSFLVVNIAGARVYMIRDGATVFEARAVVGARQTKTPVFSASLQYIELNPSWTVPPGIVDEVLRLARRDRGYLERNGIRVLDRAGRAVDPGSIDFGGYSGRTFPYVFRQQPGAANPLGRVKLVFPNQYNVYLHDTPATELFGRPERTFSHGCIRVENPVRLAELVLDDPARWPADSLATALAPGTTRTIPLRAPLRVLVLYWTAAADLHGELHFHRDVYGRDPALLAALSRP